MLPIWLYIQSSPLSRGLAWTLNLVFSKDSVVIIIELIEVKYLAQSYPAHSSCAVHVSFPLFCPPEKEGGGRREGENVMCILRDVSNSIWKRLCPFTAIHMLSLNSVCTFSCTYLWEMWGTAVFSTFLKTRFRCVIAMSLRSYKLSVGLSIIRLTKSSVCPYY